MRWEPDVSRGDWIRPRLDDEHTQPWTMHLMVPRGFERYARVVHRTGSPDDFDEPQFGRLPEHRFTAVAAHLTRHTSTPHAGVAAVWEGHGDLFTRDYGRSWAVLDGPDPDPIPGLPDEVFHGPRLQLPWRGHVLFDAGVSEFAPGWPTRAPWVHGSFPQTPSILWPDDHAWVLVTDTDWTSTIVGGPAELVAALLRDPAVDGEIVRSDTPPIGFA